MIGKKVPNPDHSASKAVRIGSLAAYIRAPESESSTEKCVHYGGRGFLTETPTAQAAEMLALAEDAVLTRDPVNHYVLSWREGERPTPEQVEEAVDILVDEMELDEHQLIYGLHADTDNWHLHVMVNRAYWDEETDRVRVKKINRGYDIDAVHRVGVRIEWAQGWEVEANKRYRVLGDGTLERASGEESEATAGGPGQQQLDRERRTGEKSAVRSASELAAPIVAGARSWEELHARLAKRGLRYERATGARTGAVVTIGEVTVKASRVSREATLGKLESRLGPFRPSDRSRERPVEPADAAPLIAAAKSWRELHTGLAEFGLRYERVGSGARVVADALEMKASVVSRDASLARLEQRLGPFEPAAATVSEEDPSARKAPAKADLKAVARLVADAKSWAELHATLAEHDLRYERFGSGGRIIAGAIVFKASTVGRDASLGALEKRLGAFEPAIAGAPVSREPQALDPEMARIDEYRAARDAYRRERDAEWRDLDSGHDDERTALAQKQANERGKLDGHDWHGLGAALNAMRSVLAHEHAMERAELREKRRKRREALRRRYPPWPSYEEWLRAKGLSDWAGRWRYQRPAAFEGPGESLAVPRDIRGYRVQVCGERVLYRRRGSPPRSPAAFRDVGKAGRGARLAERGLDARRTRTLCGEMGGVCGHRKREIQGPVRPARGRARIRDHQPGAPGDHRARTRPGRRRDKSRRRPRTAAGARCRARSDVRADATDRKTPERTRDVEPEIARIAALHKDAAERGIDARWTLPVPERWDGDVDRLREFLLRAANGEILYRGRHSARALAGGIEFHHGVGPERGGAVLEGMVEMLDAARDRPRPRER